MSKDKTQPAFAAYDPNSGMQCGMTLRDYAAFHADVPWNAVMSGFELKYGRTPTVSEAAKYSSQIRYAHADAMLAERAK